MFRQLSCALALGASLLGALNSEAPAATIPPESNKQAEIILVSVPKKEKPPEPPSISPGLHPEDQPLPPQDPPDYHPLPQPQKPKPTAYKEGKEPEDPPVQLLLPPIVVTATRLPTEQEATGITVRTVSKKEIEVTQKATATEVLRMVPGVVINQSGNQGSLTSVRIRGGESDHNLMLWDGFKVNRQGGTINLQSLDPVGLERVEIAAGPASMLFGSESVTGTIQFLTEKGKGRTSITTSAAGGNFGQVRTTMQVQGEQNKFSYNANVARYARGDTHGIDNTGVEIYNWSIRLDYDLHKETEAYLKVITRGTAIDKGWSESNASGYGSAVELPDPNDSITGLEHLYGFEGGFKPMSIWKTKLRVGLFESNGAFDSRDPQVESPTAPSPWNVKSAALSSFRERRYMIDWQNDIVAYETEDLSLTVTAGLYLEKEEVGIYDKPVGDAGIRKDFSHTNTAEYVQLRISAWERVYFTTGVRQEQNADFGPFTSLRSDISVLVPEVKTRFFGSVGNAFRAPNFLDLYGFGGNKNLNPEKNLAFDIGAEHKFWRNRAGVKATYFQNQFKDLMDFDPVSFTLANIGKASTRGVELSAWVAPWERLRFDFSATYLATEGTKGEELLRRPDWVAVARTIYTPIDKLDLSMELIHVGERLDLGPTPDNAFAHVKNHSYRRVDVAASYKFWNDRLRAFVRVQNLLDADYEDVKTYPSEGINLLGGLELHWGF